MTQHEFNSYKQNVLTKSTGLNIHSLTNLLGAMQTCIKSINTPEGDLLIQEAKKKIYNVINSGNNNYNVLVRY